MTPISPVLCIAPASNDGVLSDAEVAWLNRQAVANSRDYYFAGSCWELSVPSELTQQIEQLEGGMPGGMAQAFILAISRRIEENPVPGISSYLHLCLVSQGGVLARNNNKKWITQRADRKDVIMPQVTTSLDDLGRLLGANVVYLKRPHARLRYRRFAASLISASGQLRNVCPLSAELRNSGDSETH